MTAVDSPGDGAGGTSTVWSWRVSVHPACCEAWPAGEVHGTPLPPSCAAGHSHHSLCEEIDVAWGQQHIQNSDYVKNSKHIRAKMQNLSTMLTQAPTVYVAPIWTRKNGYFCRHSLTYRNIWFLVTSYNVYHVSKHVIHCYVHHFLYLDAFKILRQLFIDIILYIHAKTILVGSR